MTKPVRHLALLKVVEQEAPYSQEDLRKSLARKGFKVTQATLSRDIHELGLVKGSEGYQFPSGAPAPLAVESVLPSATRLVPEFVLDVRTAQNQVVIKTAVGSASTVAASLDGEEWPEVIGTIAGDDTILIVTEDNKTALRFAHRVKGLLA